MSNTQTISISCFPITSAYLDSDASLIRAYTRTVYELCSDDDDSVNTMCELVAVMTELALSF